jgi:hypothetical protein
MINAFSIPEAVLRARLTGCATVFVAPLSAQFNLVGFTVRHASKSGAIVLARAVCHLVRSAAHIAAATSTPTRASKETAASAVQSLAIQPTAGLSGSGPTTCTKMSLVSKKVAAAAPIPR